MSTATFDYGTMVSRNLGFLSREEQERLRTTPIFVCGVGGMGGAAVHTLVRAGAERLMIADPDRFELSNLNRQVFSDLESLGRSKVAVAEERLRRINPAVRLETFGGEWQQALSGILDAHRVVINGMDDTLAAIRLYRAAGPAGATVVDAFTSPLPSVAVVRPGDPRPEEWLGFGTAGRPVESLGDEDAERARLAEIRHVFGHSRSLRHFDPAVAADVLAGRRPRPSFAPMVLLTGNLMAFETIKIVLGRRSVGYRGAFFNPWTFRIERPVPRPIALFRRLRAYRWLAKGGRNA